MNKLPYPHPEGVFDLDGKMRMAFTIDQMRQYADSSVKAALEEYRELIIDTAIKKYGYESNIVITTLREVYANQARSTTD